MVVNEDLPQFICNECALHLNVSFAFKKKVINAEKLCLDALTESEERKPQAAAHANATHTNVQDEMLESQLEVEQKIIPDETELNANEQTQPETKYVQANLMHFFNNNELIELSDTDSDSTVDSTEIQQNRALSSRIAKPAVNLRQVELQQNELECPICPAFFPNPIAYNTHVDGHAEKRCKKCNRMCYYTSSLLLHFRTHANENMQISCLRCSFTASTKALLETHMQQYHNTAPRPNSNIAYQCNDCERVLVNFDRLRDHLRIDHNHQIVNDTHALQFATEVDKSEMSKCKTCGRQLSNYRCLIVHMRLHERDRLNFCYVCEQSFRHDQNMYLHFKSQHPGLKPYKCTGGHCEETFETLKLYDAHMRYVKTSNNASGSNVVPTTRNVQQNQMPKPPSRAPINRTLSGFDCYVCENRFTTENDQINHMKTHTKFTCKKCRQIYLKWRSLYDHYEQHHPNGEWTGMFVCQQCGRKFPTTRSLSNHERSHKVNITQ